MPSPGRVALRRMPARVGARCQWRLPWSTLPSRYGVAARGFCRWAGRRAVVVSGEPAQLAVGVQGPWFVLARPLTSWGQHRPGPLMGNGPRLTRDDVLHQPYAVAEMAEAIASHRRRSFRWCRTCRRARVLRGRGRLLHGLRGDLRRSLSPARRRHLARRGGAARRRPPPCGCRFRWDDDRAAQIAGDPQCGTVQDRTGCLPASGHHPPAGCRSGCSTRRAVGRPPPSPGGPGHPLRRRRVALAFAAV